MENSRGKLVKVAVRAIVVLLVVAGVCLFSVSGLKREVTHLVQKTLPGLQHAALADSLMSQNYIRCLNLASSPTTKDFDLHLREIKETTRQTDVYLEKYRETIFDKEDETNFVHVQSVRSIYIRNREQLFTMLDQQKPGALHYLKASVVPAYNDYSQSMARLFEHKVKIGEIRREQVMLLSFMTPIVVGILFILLFVLGLLVSFKFIMP